MRCAVLAAAAAAVMATVCGASAAGDKPYVMKITLPTLDDAVHQYAKNYAAAVEKDSGGRIKAEIYPASQLGSIARQTEGVQFGAIQCQIVVSPDEQATMLGILASVGDDVSRAKPLLKAAYEVIKTAAQSTR